MDTSKADEWRRRLDEYSRSGLSRSAYCRQINVSTGSFDYWRNRLGSPSSSTSEKGEFIRVDRGHSEKIEVELPGGIILRLPISARAIEVLLEVLHARS